MDIGKNGIIYDPSKIQRYPKVDLIVIRINKSKELLNAKPCSKCLNVIKQLKINNIYYSNDQR